MDKASTEAHLKTATGIPGSEYLWSAVSETAHMRSEDDPGKNFQMPESTNLEHPQSDLR